MNDRLRFTVKRIGEKLWVKPLAMCILSVTAVFAGKMADELASPEMVPDISQQSIQILLGILSSSMLVIATFAVASMVSAYASASTTATPRSFPLIIADDVSQNALSAFIGAFIFSIVAQIATSNSYFEASGRFAVFIMTLAVFALVIVTFVRWVDRIARLGRLGSTIDKVERATLSAIAHWRRAPHLGGKPATDDPPPEHALSIQGRQIGHVQRIDMPQLQRIAEKHGLQITVVALSGSFTAPNRRLAWLTTDDGSSPADSESLTKAVSEAFMVGDDRTFYEDPRYGMVVLSEIASRALSPAVNDPGTAIDIIGTFVRIFDLWLQPIEDDDSPSFDRVHVPSLAARDLFDDAFTGIGRDGADTIEVVTWLLKALETLATIGDEDTRRAALAHGEMVLARANQALSLEQDREVAERSAAFIRDA